MRLLSLGSGNQDSRKRIGQTEEFKMTPLFSEAVEKAGEQDRPQLANEGRAFPQYGLLCGALKTFPSGDGSAQASSDPTAASTDPRIFLNVNTPWSAFICGSQGSGKSHTLSCMLENCVLTSSTLGKLPKPLAALVFHYDKFTSYSTGQICEAAYLCSSGVPVRVLVSPSNFWARQKAYENIPVSSPSGRKPVVLPFLLQEKHLSIGRMMKLMAVSESNGPLPLYMEVCTSSAMKGYLTCANRDSRPSAKFCDRWQRNPRERLVSIIKCSCTN